jgi:hypothetical protein
VFHSVSLRGRQADRDNTGRWVESCAGSRAKGPGCQHRETCMNRQELGRKAERRHRMNLAIRLLTQGLM